MLANFATEACHACLSSIVLYYGYMIPMWMQTAYEDSILYHERPWVLLIALIFNGLSLISLSLFMSSFFHDSKVATQIGIFILFVPCSIFLFSIVTVITQMLIHWFSSVLELTDDQFTGHYYFQIGYVLPHFSFGVIFLEFLTKGGASILNF